MERTAKWILVGLITVVVSASTCFAGAWTAPKGRMYNKLSVNIYTADQQYNDSGNKTGFANDGDFSDTNINYYMEYGITDTLTVLTSLSYKWLESEDLYSVSKTDGFSDVDLGLKYRLFSNRAGVMSIQGLIKIPEMYDTDDAVPLGNGQYDTEFRLLYGHSLYPFIPGYFNLEAGYRFRAESPADEFRYLVEFGMDLTKTVYGRAKLDGIIGMGNGDLSQDVSNNPTTSLDYDLGKLDLALGLHVSPKWCFELGYRAEIYGENTAAGKNISLAVIFEY
ncbi:hypothetical protein HRM2_13870 [Desulforapulum autotrophicum HRM2]|uniref:Transporter n=1 Tax=Desulforapulum autotrophicum (strain ATCC 43914 / DSM 3382 / VKM B-1955 / HRM2) TaxID=177437 RepID=C0Q906_DESAH|nr:hypothetical protein [Desulforapulum autotrophicum]ACN14496.1 hypothetical protein HRM2_13870 [Desulforapulum autotrophicum HRM2]